MTVRALRAMSQTIAAATSDVKNKEGEHGGVLLQRRKQINVLYSLRNVLNENSGLERECWRRGRESARRCVVSG